MIMMARDQRLGKNPRTRRRLGTVSDRLDSVLPSVAKIDPPDVFQINVSLPHHPYQTQIMVLSLTRFLPIYDLDSCRYRHKSKSKT